MKERLKELREWANLVLTIAGPALIAWMLWSLNSKLAIQRLEMEKASDQKYAQQTSLDSYQTQTNTRLDRLSEQMAGARQDIALIAQRVGIHHSQEGKNHNEPDP